METDPVTNAVICHALQSIVNEMNLTLFRSAFSPVITEGRDIGGGLFDDKGRLVAQGDWDLAVFVGMLGFSVREILRRDSAELRPGDVYLTNDPFIGGTHFNDVGVIRPIFDNDTLLGFSAICGHWPDVGGHEPGSFVANAREHFSEGLRMPLVKLYVAGKPNQGVISLIEANMRIPKERLGDMRAQVAATGVAEKRFLEFAHKYGPAILAVAMDEMVVHSARLLREEIKKIPDGIYEGEDWVDMESSERPIPKRVHVRMTVEGDHMIFDFSQSDPESLSAANSTYSATSSAVFITVKSLFPDIPVNYGCFEPLQIITRKGTVVDALPPRALSSMAATVFEKIIGSCIMALSKALPEHAVGCPCNLVNLTMGGTQNGEDYIAYLFSEGGFGGRATKDGPAGLVSLYGGGARITPVEVFEQRYPMEFEEWSLWPDSGGPGKYRGGVGSRKTFRLTSGEARLSCLGDREYYPPFGVMGGCASAKHGLILNEGMPSQQQLSLRVAGQVLKDGDRVTIHCGGGGGYGDPLERDTKLVASDVLKGYVTVERAALDYGVAVSSTGQVDEQKTKDLRYQMGRRK